MKGLPWAITLGYILLYTAVQGGATDRTRLSRAVAEAEEPCTATSPLTGSYFDLRPLSKGHQGGGDWTAKGHDYNTNFTLSICGNVHSPPSSEFHSIPSHANVSAFYTKDGVQYSIGQASAQPHFRGRKLVLEYTRGSLCPKLSEDGDPIPDEDNKEGYRKSTLISLVCDRELFAKATVTFVGELNDCSYFFEVRTASACPTVKQQALGPVSIFGIIGLVALVVYFIGGCVYQRTVMHARGWRQIPHSQTWANSLFLIWSAFVMVGNSIASLAKRLVGGRPQNAGGRFRGGRSSAYSRIHRGSDSQRRDGWSEMDDENRLIDQLDEDWPDDV